jgi:hypothetical protein
MDASQYKRGVAAAIRKESPLLELRNDETKFYVVLECVDAGCAE